MEGWGRDRLPYLLRLERLIEYGWKCIFVYLCICLLVCWFVNVDKRMLHSQFRAWTQLP